ncbi:hypothetical protein CJP74_04075 [Psittacicella melopsittaci]|uniref:Sucrose-6-phosphate hydrolase n=1 Tax=Psittacicella melopsittaci TaxID=2028576 RepID=A0A3A1Y5W7_9GAMM|nr:glycoside hydrolase family 32 protein [Psittacicella melopsittaci]RIY32670.1 hypothetical protein CJP74_04075 [Psittacicella melopsittaci]
MQKKDYLQKYSSQESLAVRQSVAQDPYRLHYHIQPEQGWVNDPNGLCVLDGQVHIYFQYSPFNAKGGEKLWGHVSTKDYLNFKEYEPALYPDNPADADGVYSGSAFVKDGVGYFYYTGNVKHRDQDYDYIYAGREHNTILVTSRDGKEFTSKQVLLRNTDYPEDMTCHVRDPKVWEYQGRYYMILGARDVNNHGLALIYVSDDLTHWDFHMRINVDHKLGYMLECPDLFELDGQWFLISCPQGMEAEDWRFNNIYQCGYQTLDIDLEGKTYKFTSDFIELDAGFDFYAPQTFVDEQGRRILIGWFGLPDIPYTNPTVEAGWQHCLSIPRVLYNNNGVLDQRPLPELQNLRQTSIVEAALTPAKFHQGFATAVYELDLIPQEGSDLRLALRSDVTLEYDAATLTLTLNMGEQAGAGREQRKVVLDKQLQRLHVFSDTSSLEIFVNTGEVVFNTRVYSSAENQRVQLLSSDFVKAELYQLGNIKVTKEK